MAEIERFRHSAAEWPPQPDPDGEWVRYSDHRSALATELERLAEEFKERAVVDGHSDGWREAYEDAAFRLRERAAELRGGDGG